jgi:hypothetical protein
MQVFWWLQIFSVRAATLAERKSDEKINEKAFGTFCSRFGNIVAIWYIFPRFGILYLKTLPSRGKRSGKVNM